jgi:hydroxyacylglutathione hydrolase
MPLELVTVPCLSDNYAFLLHETGTGETALVDAPEAAPIRAELDRRGWRLSEIWITHHHADHVQAVDELRAATGAHVLGNGADAKRLPPLDREVRTGETFDFAGHDVRVIDVAGHTVGHVAFYVADAKAAFTADSLMALGCGRLFEGTAPQMWESLQRLAALPPDTRICSGHEYTQSNARFARTIEPDNPALISRIKEIDAARAEGRPTVPSRLETESLTNPFLRAVMPELQEALGLSGYAPSEVFAEIRSRKDRFQ